MHKTYSKTLTLLAGAGWAVERGKRLPLEPAIHARYHWLPATYVTFIEETRSVVSADAKAWFMTSSEVAGTEHSAFAWNEWELLSLDAAEGDVALRASIVHFWDRHFPIMHTLDDGYGYFALASESLEIVRGTEPEFEEPSVVAPSIAAFLKDLSTAGSGGIARTLAERARLR